LLENTKYDFLLQMDWINTDFGAPMQLPVKQATTPKSPLPILIEA